MAQFLICNGACEALLNFVLVQPDLKIRLRLVKLLGEQGSPSIRAQLLKLASNPVCDPRVAERIRRVIAATHLPSGANGRQILQKSGATDA